MSLEDDEPERTVPLDRALIARLGRFLRPHRGVLALGAALLVASRACDWALPRVLENAVNGPLLAAIQGAETGALADAARPLLAVALVYLAIAVVHGALQYFTATVLAKLGQVTTVDVRRAVFRHVLRLPLSWFDKKPVGELVTRMTGDVENLIELFSTGAASLVLDPLWIVSVLVTLFVLD